MRSKIELEAIMKIIDSLNFYQILKISSAASVDEIREAFHKEALDYHPDHYFSVPDREMLELSKKIYAKIAAAYRTLSHSKRREEYDKTLRVPSFFQEAASTSDGIEDENEITAVRPRPATSVTPAGIRFFKLAQAAYASKNFPAAKMNLQIALNTDPHHPEFLQLLERVESEIKKTSVKPKT